MHIPDTISFGTVLDATNSRLLTEADSHVRLYLAATRQRAQDNLLRVLDEKRFAQPIFWSDPDDGSDGN